MPPPVSKLGRYHFIAALQRVLGPVLGRPFGFDGRIIAGLGTDMSNPSVPNAAPGKILSPAAKRALEEAEQRRKAEQDASSRPTEKAGPKGAEPTRYGDWERGGIAYDF